MLGMIKKFRIRKLIKKTYIIVRKGLEQTKF